MKILKYTCLYILLISCFGANAQSAKKMNKYLMEKWVSVANIYDGDTIATEVGKEVMELKKGGELSMTGQGIEMDGVWKYLEETNQLEMELTTMDGKDVTAMNMKVGLDILTAEKKMLTVSKQGKKTVIYVVDGSGIRVGK